MLHFFCLTNKELIINYIYSNEQRHRARKWSTGCRYIQTKDSKVLLYAYMIVWRKGAKVKKNGANLSKDKLHSC